MKKWWGTFCIAFSLISHANAADNPPIKNGMPCLKEVCVGDDITALSGLQWDKVDTLMNNPFQRQAVTSKLPELRKLLIADETAIKAIAPYWRLNSFDGKGFLALTKIRGVCEPVGLVKPKATYKSSSGHKTSVWFEPIASDDGKTQHFLVVNIVRYFEGKYTQDQKSALAKEIGERYKDFPSYSFGDLEHPTIEWDPYRQELKLAYPLGDRVKRADALRRFPGCGGNASLRMD